MSTDNEHRFGGAWTEIKLAAIQKYLRFYTTALKDKPTRARPFRKIYLDGFAGSGNRTSGRERETEHSPGSATLALENDPPFDEYHLIENHKGRAKALQEICQQHPTLDANVHYGDANEEISRLCDRIDWRKSRAVLFLDPYGLSVKWDTLKKVSETEAVDMWFLFSISGMYRQAARRYEGVDEHKERKLNECLGTNEWKTAFYSEPRQPDIFGEDSLERHGGWRDLLLFVQDRLHTLFPRVPEPLILPPNGAPYFALFFACANPNPRAQRLSLEVAEYILKAAR